MLSYDNYDPFIETVGSELIPDYNLQICSNVKVSQCDDQICVQFYPTFATEYTIVLTDGEHKLPPL